MNSSPQDTSAVLVPVPEDLFFLKFCDNPKADYIPLVFATLFLTFYAYMTIDDRDDFDFSHDGIFWIASMIVFLMVCFDIWWFRKQYQFTTALFLLNAIVVVIYTVSFISAMERVRELKKENIGRPN